MGSSAVDYSHLVPSYPPPPSIAPRPSPSGGSSTDPTRPASSIELSATSKAEQILGNIDSAIAEGRDIDDADLKAIAGSLKNEHKVKNENEDIHKVLTDCGYSPATIAKVDINKIKQHINEETQSDAFDAKVGKQNHEIGEAAKAFIQAIDYQDHEKATNKLNELEQLVNNHPAPASLNLGKVLVEQGISSETVKDITTQMTNFKRDKVKNEPSFKELKSAVDLVNRYENQLVGTPNREENLKGAYGNLADVMHAQNMNVEELKQKFIDAGDKGLVTINGFNHEELEKAVETKLKDNVGERNVENLQKTMKSILLAEKGIVKTGIFGKDKDDLYKQLAGDMHKLNLDKKDLSKIVNTPDFLSILSDEQRTDLQSILSDGDDRIGNACQNHLLSNEKYVEVMDKARNFDPKKPESFKELAEVCAKNGINPGHLPKMMAKAGCSDDQIKAVTDNLDKIKTDTQVQKATNRQKTIEKIKKRAFIAAIAVIVVALAVLSVAMVVAGIACLAYPPAMPLGIALILGGAATALGATTIAGAEFIHQKTAEQRRAGEESAVERSRLRAEQNAAKEKAEKAGVDAENAKLTQPAQSKAEAQEQIEILKKRALDAESKTKPTIAEDLRKKIRAIEDTLPSLPDVSPPKPTPAPGSGSGTGTGSLGSTGTPTPSPTSRAVPSPGPTSPPKPTLFEELLANSRKDEDALLARKPTTPGEVNKHIEILNHRIVQAENSGNGEYADRLKERILELQNPNVSSIPLRPAPSPPYDSDSDSDFEFSGQLDDDFDEFSNVDNIKKSIEEKNEGFKN